MASGGDVLAEPPVGPLEEPQLRARTDRGDPRPAGHRESRLSPVPPSSFQPLRSRYCFTQVIQLNRYIQMLAEWSIAFKRAAMRRFLALLLLPMLAMAASSCRQQPQGAVRAIVIGGPPELRDPGSGALGSGDAVLLQNVAQGLVSFDAGGNIVGGL